jgi:hypothetical protein
MAEVVVHSARSCHSIISNSKGDSGGDIKATKRGETEHQESGGGRQAETDTETAAEEDADCAWKTSGEIEKGEVPPDTQEIGWFACEAALDVRDRNRALDRVSSCRTICQQLVITRTIHALDLPSIRSELVSLCL